MCALPLCTEIVWPTIAGTIVDARDHVRITRFSREALSFSIFAIRLSATNGPFLRERPTLLAPFPDDHFRSALVAPRFESHCHLSPRRRRRSAGSRARFTAAVRMIDGIHRDAAHVRTLAAVTLAT